MLCYVTCLIILAQNLIDDRKHPSVSARDYAYYYSWLCFFIVILTAWSVGRLQDK